MCEKHNYHSCVQWSILLLSERGDQRVKGIQDDEVGGDDNDGFQCFIVCLEVPWKRMQWRKLRTLTRSTSDGFLRPRMLCCGRRKVSVNY